jgi:glycosyltransferase involved in cell wall biosynthesis
MVPRIAHFVFGLEEQREPFEFIHYAALESCRRVLEPDRICFHHLHRPWGPWWERIEGRLELVPAALAPEVLATDYSHGDVDASHRYAHHADLIRLDVLIRDGGLYADIDTIFTRPVPDELYDAPFVIGRELPSPDERSGELRPSLCNALLLAEPGAEFARAWRERMPAALNGTWNNHSGFLAAELAGLLPQTLRIEPERSFFPFEASPRGLSDLLERRAALPRDSYSVHLWQHVWWERRRRSFADANRGWAQPRFLRYADTTLAELVRPYLPAPVRRARPWSYLVLDEDSGYGVAADRMVDALEGSGQALQWVPLVRGAVRAFIPRHTASGPGEVLVAHTMPEYYRSVREQNPAAFLVGHAVWETDRLPGHWPGLLRDADMLIVPCRFNGEVFSAIADAPPIEVVPHVAPARLSAEPLAIDPAVFVFYTIAEWTTRKAVFHTVNAYLDAFRAGDDVLLVIKTSDHDWNEARPALERAVEPGRTSWSLARLLAGRRDVPPIRLIAGTAPERAIEALHARGDCFVSLSRGEGWGLGAFDAAAHAKPVIATGWGGALDYLGGSPYLVGYELVAVHDPAGEPSYTPDQHWAEPSLAQASALMRQVAADPAPAREWAARRAAEIGEHYSPDAVAEQLRAAVERHRPRRANRRGA